MKLDIEPNEAQYIVNVLGTVPTGQTIQAGMGHLIPKILQQANGQAIVGGEQKQPEQSAAGSAA